MLKATTVAIALLMSAQSALATPRCVTEMRDFDYLETSPQQFNRATAEEISVGYRALLDAVGEISLIDQATQYFVDAETFSRVTARECDGELCAGRDLLHGLEECANELGTACYPLAAIKDGTIYCVLMPTYEYGQPEFQPFE